MIQHYYMCLTFDEEMSAIVLILLCILDVISDAMLFTSYNTLPSIPQTLFLCSGLRAFDIFFSKEVFSNDTSF